jgi:hypothetical protein
MLVEWKRIELLEESKRTEIRVRLGTATWLFGASYNIANSAQNYT